MRINQRKVKENSFTANQRNTKIINYDWMCSGIKKDGNICNTRNEADNPYCINCLPEEHEKYKRGKKWEW